MPYTLEQIQKLTQDAVTYQDAKDKLTEFLLKEWWEMLETELRLELTSHGHADLPSTHPIKEAIKLGSELKETKFGALQDGRTAGKINAALAKLGTNSIPHYDPAHPESEIILRVYRNHLLRYLHADHFMKAWKKEAAKPLFGDILAGVKANILLLDEAIAAIHAPPESAAAAVSAETRIYEQELAALSALTSAVKKAMPDTLAETLQSNFENLEILYINAQDEYAAQSDFVSYILAKNALIHTLKATHLQNSQELSSYISTPTLKWQHAIIESLSTFTEDSEVDFQNRVALYETHLQIQARRAAMAALSAALPPQTTAPLFFRNTATSRLEEERKRCISKYNEHREALRISLLEYRKYADTLGFPVQGEPPAIEAQSLATCQSAYMKNAVFQENYVFGIQEEEKEMFQEDRAIKAADQHAMIENIMHFVEREETFSALPENMRRDAGKYIKTALATVLSSHKTPLSSPEMEAVARNINHLFSTQYIYPAKTRFGESRIYFETDYKLMLALVRLADSESTLGQERLTQEIAQCVESVMQMPYQAGPVNDAAEEKEERHYAAR